MEIRVLNTNEILNLINFVHQVEEIDATCNDFLEVSPWFFKVKSGKETMCYGVFDGEQLVGYCLVGFDGVHPNNIPRNAQLDKEALTKCAVINSFLVHPNFRGKSLQKRLNKVAETEAINRGFLHMAVNVRSDNKFAKNNLKDCGYVCLNPRNNYKGIETYIKSLI